MFFIIKNCLKVIGKNIYNFLIKEKKKKKYFLKQKCLIN